MKLKIKINPEVFNSIYIEYLDEQTRTQIFFGGSASLTGLEQPESILCSIRINIINNIERIIASRIEIKRFLMAILLFFFSLSCFQIGFISYPFYVNSINISTTSASTYSVRKHKPPKLSFVSGGMYLVIVKPHF